jgi:hypothetical protein
MNYSRLENIDYKPLLECYYQIEDKILWANVPGKSRQTSVQYAIDEDPFLSSTGTLPARRRETEYNLLNPLFDNTPIEDVVKKYKLVRSRLMWVEPRTCYSIHSDFSPRIHIPLVTNEDCRFIFPDESEIFYLPLGGIYKVDTYKKHSFCNFSTKPRLHLLGCIY